MREGASEMTLSLGVISAESKLKIRLERMCACNELVLGWIHRVWNNFFCGRVPSRFGNRHFVENVAKPVHFRSEFNIFFLFFQVLSD
jgi:hypothetical protein